MSDAGGSGIYDAEYSDSDNESETGLSEESDSDSSDGSDVEEEDNDDEEEEEDEDDEYITEESQIVDVPAAAGISSDEGGEKESCPICFNRFIGQDLGIPENCEHIFCLECIKEWSKNINTCPIDRNEFNYVNLKATPNGKVLKKIRVKVLPKEPENALQQEITLCEVCHRGDREDRLLLCDACDLAYHCECLDPPLFRVPVEEWFCPPCSGILQNGAIAGPSAPRYRRVIPRTRASENVRTRVEDRRTRPAISRSPSTARKKTPQKRKRRAYRRSYKKVVTLARTKKNLMDGSKGKDCPRSTAVIVTYRRRRRRRKKRRIAKKSATASKSSAHSAQKRISKHLGLVKPSKGGSIPDVKSKSKSSSKSVIPTGSSHYLFGDKNQLMDFNESFHEDVPGPSRRQQEEITPQPSSSSINILDSIMAGQKILHTKSNDVIIKKDGSLVLKDNKTKEKGIFKKPSMYDKVKEKEIIKEPNTSERLDEKEKGAIKKSNFYDKTNDRKKGIIKKPETNNKVKSGRVTFGEPSELQVSLKAETHSEKKPSPMLLAALARRRGNEMSNQSALDCKSKSPSSVERIAASADSHQYSFFNQSDQNMNVQTDGGHRISSKASSFDLKTEMNESSSSFETSKKSAYFHKASSREPGKSGPIKNNFQNFGQFSPNSDYQSLPFSTLDTPSIKNEIDNKRSLFKSENCKKSLDKSCLSAKQELNTNRFHSVSHSTSSEGSKSTRQSHIKNGNISSNDHVKKTGIQKCIKKEKTIDLLSEESVVANNNSSVTRVMSPDTETDYEVEDTMDFLPSQSLIPDNSDELLSSLNKAKQSLLYIKKEPVSFTEKSDSECSQSSVEPLHKQLQDNSQLSHRSLNGKTRDLKLKIKKELESSDDDTCQFPNIEKSHAFIESHRETINEIMNDDDTTTSFEDSQSIITQTVAETTKTSNTNRIKPKVEVNSSDEESDICLVSSSYSQLKSMNNLNNKKYATEDVFKRKIKEEHPSSEDEGGESCSLLTDNLPFIPLTERNDLFNSHQTNSFSCGVAINSSLNEQTNDLPCTQLAKTSCDQKDKSLFTHSTKFPLNAQDDVCKISDELENDLPPTQFAVPASVNYKKEEDVLPSTQPSSPLSSMQMDDLPCTQLVVPALIKEMFKREDALPSTRPSSPVSQMQIANLASTQLMGTLSKKTIFDEEDELPCTQLVRPVSNMEIEDLPCTQLAMPLPNKQIDGLPDTQFIKPALVKYNSKKEDNALPATQPSSSLPQTDDLPCTQLVEAISSKSVFNEEDSIPCTQLARSLSSVDIEDLPCTQLAKPLSNMDMEDLPCTQLARPSSIIDMEDLPCTQLAKPLSNMDMEDLPCTQLAKPLSNKDMEDLPCTQLAKPLSNMDMEDLPCTQLAKPLSNMDMEDLPCTQLAKPLSNMDMEDLPSTQLARPSSIIDMEDLPSTQFVVPAPVKYFSKKKDALPTMQPPNSLPQMQTDDLPKTQLVKSLSKTEVSNEEDTLPCTQLARPLSSMDMEDLPCTQLAKPLSDMDMEDLPCTQLAKPLSNMQVDDLPCTQFAVPVPIKYLPKKKDVLLTAQSPNSLSQMQTNDVRKTQVVKTSLSDEEDTLPCTQLARPFSSMDMEDMSSSQLAKPLSGMQMDDLPSTQFVAPASVKRAAKKDEDALPAAQPSSPLYNMEMDDLPCTQLVKSSSVKSLSDKGDDDTLPCTQRSNPVSNLHLDESTNPCLNQNTNVQSKELPTCNANDDDFDLPETQPLISDQQHSKLEKLLENSSDELITDEELLSDIKKLEIKKPIPRKIVGIHKNLPQVLMPIPSRRNPVPKPSNRRTFSFDQVKQQYDTTDEKNALHENISHEAKLVVTKIGDLSTIQTFSSALKEKQQVSSKCKTENPNSLKDEIYSAPNCDFKIKTDKNNVPPDSEIEIINDDETGTKSIEEVVLSSDEEDLPATQFIVRASNQCSRLPNQGKLENVCISVKREHNTSDILPETQKCTGNNKSADVVDISEDCFEKLVVKKEIISGDPEIEIVKTLNSVSVKQEKCEEDILREVKIKPLQQLNGKVLTSVSVKQENCEEDTLREVKIEPLQQLKTEEQVGRLIKSKNESLDLEDSTNVRNIQYADKCKNQKMSNGEDIYNDSINKCALGLEKHVREHKIIINDHNRKKAKGHSNSSEDKLKIENGKKNKPERNPEIGTHSDVENKVETKTSSRSLSKTNGNSKIKVNTENVNQLKLINKDKKSKTEHISPSQTHAKIEPIKNHKLVTEKSKSSSKEKNYYEDSKKRKLSNLDNSEKVQNHKKLKGDSLTIKKEPLSDKNGKSSLKKNFDVRKDAHELKNNIKMEDSRRESSEKTIKTDKISNSGKVKEAVVGYDSKNRKDDKYAKIHNKKFESKSSNKSSSEMNLKIKESDAHDKKGNIKHVNSDNKCKGYGNIPFSEKERPNGKIKAESDSIQKVKNQLKDSKTNFKNESAKTNLVLKRSASNEGERNTKRPHRESLSCSEDTSDCHSDYSRSSVISSESNFRKKYKHQRNALNVLNEVADEIISSSKDCKTDILNQNEDVTFEVMKRNKNPSAVGRKVDKAHLKDEIAAEVKIALKPFYSVGLIDKDDYKDIMRKAVPKIYLNCGNYVIPEKIRNLVSSYVKKLTNS
ncbi:uncharacterized protein LOC129975203 [Argiope bruennichi]|uniref:uncharacterized protein LOC129975203 n=1 Tax=Argiope bruennichi TaxID=94029 RepID=UPI0024940FD9|nr:uncharacterized protein LOC129975203 [Argiope bruennichi]XP_055944165.1 uncharacterized protein LOC129975203 [Argiope bruennichi]XP_055944166.1 uncharacterized protein LOC129975203 [Argiope bruennichi]